MTSVLRSLSSAALLGVLSAALGLSACSKSDATPDPGLEGLQLRGVSPEVILPGSTIALSGRSFVSDALGESRLRLEGLFDGGSGDFEIEVVVPASFVDFDRMEAVANPAFLSQFASGTGEFTGVAWVEVDSRVDGKTYSSEKEFVVLELRDRLTPGINDLTADGLIFVNDQIQVSGFGLLLGTEEGTTYALVEGCFVPEADTLCTDVSTREIAVTPTTEFDRDSGSFPFAPSIAGIQPGQFRGTVSLRNDHGGGLEVVGSSGLDVQYDLTEPVVFSLSPTAASLGQYVDISGGGFLGGGDGGLTLIELNGEFRQPGSELTSPVDLVLVPEFKDGKLVRYVMNEDDELGRSLDLRTSVGTFTGQVIPVVSYEGQEVRGSSTSFELAVAPLKQVVYLNFTHTYYESLRHFGLRAVDGQIRERIRQVLERDFATISLEARLEEPADFALYSVVDINGWDPNEIGLLGYDNSPGKDTGNERLHDHIGGANAQTQEDGYPGYGGVFIESLFAFSKHPGGFARTNPLADDLFDDVFDPFRPDRSGKPVSAVDLGSAAVDPLTSGDICPAVSRPEQIACAVFVLGSMVGSTLSHEVGHSLGLANPFGSGFHNPSDEVNRLMDSGGDRPFTERAELLGDGPAVFCETEYEYLREILPTAEPADSAERPSCF